MILDNIGDAGQIKRKVYQRRLPENPNLDYYYIIRDTAPRESVLIEYGFIDNPNDLNKLRNDLDEYAEGVVKAIADYVNVPYTKPGISNGEVEEGYYIVQKGDTLWSIANKYGITVDELKELNDLTSNTISIGQRLKVSSTTPEGVYIVQKGDTLWSIANKTGISVDELKRINNLTSNTISIGQELKLSSSNTNNTDDNIYIVQKGDSLWAIANKYGITVNDLINYNNLNSLTLIIGQELRIPPSQVMYYTVANGDTLWSIAKKYNTTVDKIISANNLTSTTLSIGQNLIIP